MESKLEIPKELVLNNIIAQVNSILSQPKDEETNNNIIYKYVIKVNFNFGPDTNKIISPNAEEINSIL